MPITLKNQAYALPGPQTVALTPDECQQLYGEGAKPVYAYAPVGAKEDASKWDAIAWKSFEAQFSQLCDQLEAIRAQGLLFFTEEEGSDEKNKKLYENQNNFKDRYADTIKKFKNDVLFHPNNTNSRYAVQLGNPLFFEDIKNALEVIVLKLQADVKKLKETDPYDIAEKASALKLFDEAVREASVCDEGAHTKLISLRQDIRKTKGVKNIVALQLDGVFTRMASRYIKRAREQNLGWRLELYETHAPSTIKNWAFAKGIFPEGMPYVQERYSSTVTKKVTKIEDGTEVTTYHVPENDAIGFNDADLNHNFQPQFDALFNARTVIAHLADHIAENVDAIMGNYESALKKANGVEVEVTQAKAELMEELSDFMGEMNLTHQAGILERIIQKSNDEWDIDYQRKSPLEVYYWAQVYALKGLEKDDLAEGLVREKLGVGLVFVTDGQTEWFEREDGTLITLTEVIDDYKLVENLSRLNRIKTFGLINALLEAVPEGDSDLKEALKAKRTQLKLPYNLSQLGVDRPYFCFESIEDLFALKEACNGNLYFFCLALEKAPRSMMQALFYNGLTNEKTRVKTKQFFYDLNTSEPPKELVESGIPLKREELSIYISEAFLAYLQTASEFDAEDSIPGAWLGQPAKKIPQKFWLFKDFQSIQERYQGSLADLFTLYPSMVDNYFKNVPEGKEGEALAGLMTSFTQEITVELIDQISEYLRDKFELQLSFLDSVGTNRSTLVDALFGKLREIPAEILAAYIPRVKSPLLFGKLLELLRGHEHYSEFVEQGKKVLADFNLVVCMNPDGTNCLVINSFQDILNLWARVDDKSKAIDALIVLLGKVDISNDLSSMIKAALLSETDFSTARMIIEQINERSDGSVMILPVDNDFKTIIPTIFEKFKNKDDIFAHIPNQFLARLPDDKIKRLISDLKGFETFFNRAYLNDSEISRHLHLHLEWLSSPNDLWAIIAVLKNKYSFFPNSWNSIYPSLIRYCLPRVTFPSLTKLPMNPLLDVYKKKLEDSMIDRVFDQIMEGKGSAEELLKSWGLSWEGAPSLDVMFTSESPYFEVYRAVYNRVQEGLYRVGLLTGFTEFKPFSSDNAKHLYNMKTRESGSSRLYFAIDSIDDIEIIEDVRIRENSVLKKAYRPPIQNILSAGMLNKSERKRCHAVLAKFSPEAYRYLTQEYLDHIIDNNYDAGLIPSGFDQFIGTGFVFMTNYFTINHYISSHRSIDGGLLRVIFEIHPGTALRYLTGVPHDQKAEAILVVLKSLTKIGDEKIIDQVFALIREKILEIPPTLLELVTLYPMLKGQYDVNSERVYRIYVEQLIRALPEKFTYMSIDTIQKSHVQSHETALKIIFEMKLKVNPIRSKGDLQKVCSQIQGYPSSFYQVLAHHPGFIDQLNLLSVEEIVLIFDQSIHIPLNDDDLLWDYVIKSIHDVEKRGALRLKILTEHKDAVSFELYDKLLREYQLTDPTNESLVLTRETKKKRLNAAGSRIPPLVVIENFFDLLTAYKHLDQVSKSAPLGSGFEIYRREHGNITAKNIGELIGNCKNFEFFTLKNFVAAAAEFPDLFEDKTLRIFVNKIIAALPKSIETVDAAEALAKISWIPHEQLLRDELFMFSFNRMNAQQIMSIISAITSSSGYQLNRATLDRFMCQILKDIRPEVWTQLTTPPVPEFLLLSSFLQANADSISLVRHAMLSKLEDLIGRLDEKRPDDLYVLKSVPSSFDTITGFDLLDYESSYNRAYLRASILQHYRKDDPRFTKHEINDRLAVNIFYDPDTDLYIDFPMRFFSGRWLDIRDLKNLSAEEQRILPAIGNMFLNPPGHDALRMITSDFVDKYIENLDFSVIYDVKIPAFTKRFEDLLAKQIALDSGYVDAVFVPAYLKYLVVLMKLNRKLDVSDFSEARRLLNLIPANHKSHKRLSDLLPLIGGDDRIQMHNNIDEQIENNISDFFTLFDGVPAHLCIDCIQNEEFAIILEKLSNVPKNSALYEKVCNFLQVNRESIQRSDIDYRTLYNILCLVSKDLDTANQEFLCFCSNRILTKAEIPLLTSLVKSTNLESIMNSIEPRNWSGLLVSLDVLPVTQRNLFHLLQLESGRAVPTHPLSGILHAYDASRSRGDRMKHFMKMDAAEPDFIHQLRSFCQGHSLTEQEVVKVQKLFAKHFGELYKNKMSRQGLVDDPVTQAILKVPPRQ